MCSWLEERKLERRRLLDLLGDNSKVSEGLTAGDWAAFNWELLDTRSGRYGRYTFVDAFFCSTSWTLGTKTDTMRCPKLLPNKPDSKFVYGATGVPIKFEG